ncbi:polyphosphate--glucose phosphotransferase [Corynebacterium lubricantis]|uniref:polyphosphate--glucose phosphotransferase n=1 Tax=Corynebacterium lubricantis TaxID=541095 RepID=UPI0003736AFA|nr:ROK family protein [Corynebacterium lubricantis]
MSNEHIGFGVDIGGSGIKGALVNLDSGDFVGERVKIKTPFPSTPEAVAAVVAEIVSQKEWDGPVGICMPSVIKDQIALSAANIDKSWIGTNARDVFAKALGDREISVLNDADAAGIAEVEHGIAEASEGPVIFLTIGTGIGSAFFIDGKLFPNTELGHMLVGKKEAEHQASSAVKDREELSFKKWSKRIDKVLLEYEKLFNPKLFIVGGGISRSHEKWVPRLTLETPVKSAKLRNTAGIVGAAMAVAGHVTP